MRASGRKPILVIDAQPFASLIDTSSAGARYQSKTSLAKRSHAFDSPMPKKIVVRPGKVPQRSLRARFRACYSSGSEAS